jgi:hypothetical protein
MTNPATETKSVGLQADAQLSWFLHRHLDNFIVTRKSCPLTGTSPFANFISMRLACPLTHMHMIIHCFVLGEDTKPVHEHHLQVFPTLRKPGSLLFIGTFNTATET